MLRVELYSTIHQIPHQTWDHFASQNWFHKHRFVACMEEARIPGAKYWYLLFYYDQTVIGTCIFSTCDISLDVFNPQNRILNILRKYFPGIFNIRLLMCGLPASFGQTNVQVNDSSFTEEVVQTIALELRKIAERERIQYLCIKELQNVAQWNSFQRYGFFPANSIPYMRLSVPWRSFSEYLLSLRHSYRRSIKRSLQKIGLEEPRIYHDMATGCSEFPVLVLGDTSLIPAEKFYALYLSVMQRSKTKLEVLTVEFFQSLYRNMGHDLKILMLRKGDIVYSVALLLLEEDCVTFLLVGREKEEDEFDSYFNVMYGILALAIRSGATEIKLGQTSYWVKQRIGGVGENRYFFLHARKRWIHALLKTFHPILFPSLKLPEVTVFKEKPVIGSVF